MLFVCVCVCVCVVQPDEPQNAFTGRASRAADTAETNIGLWRIVHSIS